MTPTSPQQPERKRYSPAELAEVLRLHARWRNGAGGTRANLAGANLTGACLARAYGILTVGPCDGWIMHACRHADGPRILAGCRWFTRAAAGAHWNEQHASGKQHADRMMTGVEALVALGRAHGWEGCECGAVGR